MTTLREPQVRPAPPPVREVATPQTTSWLQRHRNQVMIAGFIALIVVGLVVIAVFAAMPFGRSGNVATSAPAVVEAPAPAAAPVTAPVAPAASAPVAPVAAEQKPTANVAQPSTARGFSSGEYKSSAITSSSPNVVVAFFGASLERNGQKAAQYVESPESPRVSSLFNELADIGRNNRLDKGYFLLVGRVADHETGKVIKPEEARGTPGSKYTGAALLVSHCPNDGCTFFVSVSFEIRKAATNEWKIIDFTPYETGLWDKGAFEKRLERATGDPYNFFR